MAIVTISRQVGSLGDETAALVADKLGYKLIDRQEVHKAATECDLAFKDACSLYESETRPRGFFERLFYADPANLALFEGLTYELAEGGNVVLIGRGAHLAMAGMAGVFKVRIVAPSKIRAERIAQKKGVTLDEATRFVESHGRRRRALIESMYHQKLADWSHYDLVINTAATSAESAASMIDLGVKAMGADVDLNLLSNTAAAKKIERQIKLAVPTSGRRDVTVEVADGVATLIGFVADKNARERAGQIAADLEGVTSVENKLGTTELSF